MKTISRRDVLKASLLAPAVAASQRISPMVPTLEAEVPAPDPLISTLTDPGPSAGRERLLLDFGWRFHFGNANDPAKDFGFGNGRSGTFQKTGNFLTAGSVAFDDSDWKPLDLPHDWAVELPFENDPEPHQQGLLSAGPQLSRNQHRVVSPRFRACAGRRWQAHLH